MVTSDRSHKGLSPSITAPCPAQLLLPLNLHNTAELPTPISLTQLGANTEGSQITGSRHQITVLLQDATGV